MQLNIHLLSLATPLQLPISFSNEKFKWYFDFHLIPPSEKPGEQPNGKFLLLFTSAEGKAQPPEVLAAFPSYSLYWRVRTHKKILTLSEHTNI